MSVDAIEHWMIYREHPDVGAILHVHAWIEGTVATEINYPCGTVELAESVAELVRQAALHAEYFDHNALYHAIQALGLFLIFLAARSLT